MSFGIYQDNLLGRSAANSVRMLQLEKGEHSEVASLFMPMLRRMVPSNARARPRAEAQSSGLDPNISRLYESERTAYPSKQK